MISLSSSVTLLYEALRDIVLDPVIAEWLATNQPVALSQAQEALAAFTGIPLLVEEEKEAIGD